ncbi:hypothetical protein HYN59_12645 [Flavobacterium album]|uniref:Uncharacterized protein n=1 Tax=Flavobacterium album TaxID=2175091 RepID=A0A2S1R055_9FLAO|nr:hypothetical protein [Flavobacterium album]AWH85901.1 hypothetical protein HYN59_12645 [Flavobacterium album]
MKKITFLVAGLLLSGSLALASESTIFSGNPTHYAIDYREAEPIVFMERGIEFLVFPNGEMDFNTQPSTGSGTYYRRSDRNQSNATYGAPGTYSNGRGVRVEHDYNGRVRRVGNVFINYDAIGRVKRIGTVYMSYNSFALAQIGNLRLIYNRSGHIVDAIGYINANNRSYVYDACPATGYYDGNYQQGGYNGGTTDYDDNDVYYRKPATSTRG